MKTVALAKPVPAADLQIAEQLQDQYRKAVAGTREILIFGSMMMQVGSLLSSQKALNGNNQFTPRENTLKGWIEEFCPAINYNVAYGFYNLAKGLREALAIPIGTDIHHLLTAPEASLSKKEAKIREREEAVAKRKAGGQDDEDDAADAKEPARD